MTEKGEAPVATPGLASSGAQQELSKSPPANAKGVQLWLVFLGFCLAGFIASTDATIIFTALPTISDELGGLEEYIWLGNAIAGGAHTAALFVSGRLVQGLGAGGMVMLIARQRPRGMCCGQPDWACHREYHRHPHHLEVGILDQYASVRADAARYGVLLARLVEEVAVMDARSLSHRLHWQHHIRGIYYVDFDWSGPEWRASHWAGFGVLAISCGLFSTVSSFTSTVAWAWFEILAGIGIGLPLTRQLPVIQAVLPESDTAVSTGTYSFVESFGFVWRASIPSIVFSSVVNDKLGSIDDSNVQAALASGGAYSYSLSVRNLTGQTLQQTLDVYQQALRFAWFVGLAFALLGFLLVFPEKHVDLRVTLET
ncbi:major facilitator superfamily transporter [Seiridium cupressi]